MKKIQPAVMVFLVSWNFACAWAEDREAVIDADQIIKESLEYGQGWDAFAPYLRRLDQVTSVLSAAEWDRPLLPEESCFLVEIEVDADRGNGLDIKKIEKHGDHIWTMQYKTSGWIQAKATLAGPPPPKSPVRFQWKAVETKIDPGTQVGIGGDLQVADENVGIENTPEFLDPRSRVKLSRLFWDPDAIKNKQAQPALMVLNLKNKPAKDDDLRIVNVTPLPKAWLPWAEEAFKQRDALQKMPPEELATVALDVKQGVLIRMLATKFLKGKPQPCVKVIKGLLDNAQAQPDMALEFVLSQAIISAGGAQLKEVSAQCDAFVDREMKERPQGSKALTAYAGAIHVACSYGLIWPTYSNPSFWFHGAFLDMKRSRWCGERMDVLFTKMKGLTDHRFNQEGLYVYLFAQYAEFEYSFFERRGDAYFAAPYQWKPKPKPGPLPESPRKKGGK